MKGQCGESSLKS
jgi:hypothetical protein